jgi:hypothetical protein
MMDEADVAFHQFGTMLNFLNLKRVNACGIKQANKHVMLSSMCYNSKKYLKFKNRKANAKISTIEHNLLSAENLLFERFVSF